MKPKVSLSLSQAFTSGSYPELDASSPHLPTPFCMNRQQSRFGTGLSIFSSMWGSK